MMRAWRTLEPPSTVHPLARPGQALRRFARAVAQHLVDRNLVVLKGSPPICMSVSTVPMCGNSPSGNTYWSMKRPPP
jgi:hypothetical protein